MCLHRDTVSWSVGLFFIDKLYALNFFRYIRGKFNNIYTILTISVLRKIKLSSKWNSSKWSKSVHDIRAYSNAVSPSPKKQRLLRLLRLILCELTFPVASYIALWIKTIFRESHIIQYISYRRDPHWRSRVIEWFSGTRVASCAAIPTQWLDF